MKNCGKFVALALILGICAPAWAQSSGTSSRSSGLRLILSLGGTYEFQTVNGTSFIGPGPFAGATLEYGLSNSAAMLVALRYRFTTALNTVVSSTQADIVKISATTFLAGFHLGRFTIDGGLDRIGGHLYSIRSGGSSIDLSGTSMLPIGEIHFAFFQSGRLSARVGASYTAGTLFSNSANILQFLAQLDLALR